MKKEFIINLNGCLIWLDKYFKIQGYFREWFEF